MPKILFAEAVTESSLDDVRGSLTALGRGGEDHSADESDGGDELHLDLRITETVAFGALAQLLLIIDDACRRGMRVRIDLPHPAPPFSEGGTGRSELGGVDSVDRTTDPTETSRRRVRCLRFLAASGFLTAARLPHRSDNSVAIVGSPEHITLSPSTTLTGSDGDPWQGDDLEPDTTMRPEPFLSFRWLTPAAGEGLRRSEALAAVVRGLRRMGLSQRDARLLTSSVVIELVENVAVHAASGDHEAAPHALVGAVLVTADRSSGFTATSSELQDSVARADGTPPAVRIVVGDSGFGLVRRLAPFTPEVISDLPETIEGQPLTDGERTTIWALRRWSTSSPQPPGSRQGSRGLWHVQRAIHSYGGAVLISTADARAGLAFGSVDHGQLVRSSIPRGQPGTLVDVVVVLAARARTVAPPPRAVPTAVELNWVRISADVSTEEHAVAGARRLASSDQHVLLTIDGGRARIISPERLVDLLATAADLALPAIVAVVVAGVDPVHVDAAVDALHHPPPVETDADTPTDVGNPFILLDESGQARWCGGSAEVRELLQVLLQQPRFPITTDEAVNRFAPLLRDQHHLIDRVGDTITLVLQPVHVIDRLRRFVARNLTRTADIPGPGVMHGWFRTPNLRLSDRWLEVDEIVERACGTGTAAFLLAQQLAARAPDGLAPETHVVQMSAVVNDLVQSFLECVGLRENAYQMTDEFAMPSSVDRLRSGTPVLICADILLTENSIRRVLGELFAWGVRPIAILVPLDARDDDPPVEMFGIPVPVVRLARVRFRVPDVPPDRIIDIDPVMRAPVNHLPPRIEIRYPWDPREFLAACAEVPRLISLAHIERPANRHFTVYFNATRVIDESAAVRDTLADNMIKYIETLLPTAGSALDADSVTILHPGNVNSYAARIAGLVARRMSRRHGWTRRPAVVPIPRAVTGSRYAFPEATAQLSHRDVVILDWGSFDASTVLQLTRLAGEAGAGRIVGLVVFSQLPLHEERALTMIRSVAAGTALPQPDRGPAENRTVPATIRFVTSLGITPTLANDCALCRFIAQLRADVESNILPRQVADHASRIASLLKPMAREKALRRPCDAYGHPIETQDGIAYVELRTRVVAAMRDLTEAQRVADLLGALAKTSADRMTYAVIRLLAAEHHFIRLPPLRLASCRSDLGRIATTVATDVRLAYQLRLQAIRVLAMAAPQDLVIRMPELWTSALASPELLLHLCYQLYGALRPGPGRIPVRLSVLRDKLGECRDIDATDYPHPKLAEEMDFLLSRLIFAVDRLDAAPHTLTPRVAWARLHDHYVRLLRRHYDATAAGFQLMMLVEDLPSGDHELEPKEWELMFRGWQTIEAFLSEHLLPYLPPLRPTLTGAYADENFAPEQRALFDRLSSAAAKNELELIWARLGDLRTLRREDPAFAPRWTEFLSRFKVLYQGVLAGGNVDDSDASSLGTFIHACPAHLQRVLQRCIDAARANRSPVDVRVVGNANVLVFCHDDVLSHVVYHLIDNAATPRHRRPDDVGRLVDMEIDIKTEPDQVVVRFRNNGTVPNERPGHGLIGNLRKLQDFDATLQQSPTSEPWTFAVEVRLLPWLATPEIGGDS